MFNFFNFNKNYKKNLKKPLLILDLDNTLIHTYYIDEKYLSDPKNIPPKDSNSFLKFYHRPGLDNFLNILKKYLCFYCCY